MRNIHVCIGIHGEIYRNCSDMNQREMVKFKTKFHVNNLNDNKLASRIKSWEFNCCWFLYNDILKSISYFKKFKNEIFNFYTDVRICP